MQNVSRALKSCRVLTIRAFVLGAAFLAAGMSALARFPDFVQLVKAYHVVPGWLIPITAILLISVEIAIGLSLLIPSLRHFGAVAAVILLSLLLALAIHARINGLDISCGSFMVFQDSDIGTLVVIQNLALLTLSLVVYRETRTRGVEIIEPARQ